MIAYQIAPKKIKRRITGPYLERETNRDHPHAASTSTIIAVSHALVADEALSAIGKSFVT